MFIGRKDELKELKNWLESGEPCIAITGIGGIGKTSLAKEFTSTKDFKRSSEAIYISLKGETEAVPPIKIVLGGIGNGLKGKIAEWFGERWREIEEVSIVGVFEFKKESKEKAGRSLKQILHDLDSKLKGKKIIVIVDDLQLADEGSLRRICELANVNWGNLKWILVHRDKIKIREGLKDLSGWTPLGIEGLNKDDISKLFIEHANGRIDVKEIDKDAFFEVTKGYPNFIDTIVSALKEKYDEIEVTEDFIKKNYDVFTRPMEFVMDNYLDEDEKLNLLSIAILKEEATVESLVAPFRLAISYLKEFLKLLGVELKYEKLKEFGFIEIKNEEIDIHNAKRDRIVEVMNGKDEEQVKRVRKDAIEFYLEIALIADKEQNYIIASGANLHAYHHASHIDKKRMLHCLVNASVDFSNCGDYYSAYICSNHALGEISGQIMLDEYLTHLKLVALRVKTEVLFSTGLCRYFEFDLDEIVEEVTKTFFGLEKGAEEIRKKSLEDYIKILSVIMNYFANEGKADEILDLLKNSPLKEEQKTKLKIDAAGGLTYLLDERAKKLLEEVEERDVEGEDKCSISHIKGLWSMNDFEKASKLFEESAKIGRFGPPFKREAVRNYSLAAVLTSDRMRALKMLTNAEKNLIGDTESTLKYKFAGAIASVNRKEKVKEFFNELSKMQLGEEQKGRYCMHYLRAFILLDCIESLSLDEKTKSMLENDPLYKIISSLKDSRETLGRLDDVEMMPINKNILKGIISGGEDIEDKIAKFIGFYCLASS
jgi:hypothetical protein